MDKIKILHIQKIKGIYGSEKHLLSLLSNLNRQKYEIYFLILFTKPKSEFDSYAKLLQERGVFVKYFYFDGHFSLFTLMKIVKTIKEVKPDIVHTHLIHADLYGTLAAKIAAIPIVVSTKHGYDSYETVSKLYLLNKLFSPFVDKVITISDSLQDYCKKVEGINKKNMLTVHYGLNLDFADNNKTSFSIRENLDISPNSFLMATTGRLIPVKGHRYLLEALYSIKSEIQDWALLMLGDGELKGELELLVDKLGVGKNVYFLGFREDVSNILSSIDLFILPTLGEGFGLAILEAMAYAKPVISTNTMAIPEIVVDGETGIVVSPRNSVGITEAILKLYSSKSLLNKLGEAGKERLQRCFSIEAMVKKTEEVYESLLR